MTRETSALPERANLALLRLQLRAAEREAASEEAVLLELDVDAAVEQLRTRLDGLVEDHRVQLDRELHQEREAARAIVAAARSRVGLRPVPEAFVVGPRDVEDTVDAVRDVTRSILTAARERVGERTAPQPPTDRGPAEVVRWADESDDMAGAESSPWAPPALEHAVASVVEEPVVADAVGLGDGVVEEPVVADAVGLGDGVVEEPVVADAVGFEDDVEQAPEPEAIDTLWRAGRGDDAEPARDADPERVVGDDLALVVGQVTEEIHSDLPAIVERVADAVATELPSIIDRVSDSVGADDPHLRRRVADAVTAELPSIVDQVSHSFSAELPTLVARIAQSFTNHVPALVDRLAGAVVDELAASLVDRVATEVATEVAETAASREPDGAAFAAPGATFTLMVDPEAFATAIVAAFAALRDERHEARGELLGGEVQRIVVEAPAASSSRSPVWHADFLLALVALIVVFVILVAWST